MQSLLNYKERAKRDPVRHNSVFLHDSPIKVKGGGGVLGGHQLAEAKKEGKNV